MTAEERIQTVQNGKAVQIYIPKELSTDSQFPISPGDEVIAQVTDDGHSVVLTPVSELGDAYPDSVTAPDQRLLSPAERRLVFGDEREHDHEQIETLEP